MKKKCDESISNLLIDGQIITSAKEISNHFNNFFTSVAKKIDKNMVKPKQTHLSYLGPENNNTIFLSPTLLEDTEDIISSMKIKQVVKKEFSKLLIDIINLSFNQGIFPNLLKIANVTPIHKKVTSMIVITTDLFLFYLIVVKFMKNVCTLIVAARLVITMAYTNRIVY